MYYSEECFAARPEKLEFTSTGNTTPLSHVYIVPERYSVSQGWRHMKEATWLVWLSSSSVAYLTYRTFSSVVHENWESYSGGIQGCVQCDTSCCTRGKWREKMVLCGKAKSPIFVLPDKMPLGQHIDKVWCVILETGIRFSLTLFL